MEPAERWLPRLEVFLPEFLASQPALAPYTHEAAVALHGSTTTGVDDRWSDLDVWLLLPEAALSFVDECAGTRFFDFEIDKKPGHCNAESVTDFQRRLADCDLCLIAELRNAFPLADPLGILSPLLEESRRPMREEVALAWFRYHYVEMMSERKGGQNPSNRGQPLPLLLFSSKALAHALRAALVLDGEPYPYDKWLDEAARRSAIGSEVTKLAETLLEQLGARALEHPGPDVEHPIRNTLGAIRDLLRERGVGCGVDVDWLNTWWLHLHEARNGVRHLRW